MGPQTFLCQIRLGDQSETLSTGYQVPTPWLQMGLEVKKPSLYNWDEVESASQLKLLLSFLSSERVVLG